MKHIFIIETADMIDPYTVTELLAKINEAADSVLGETDVVHHSCNHESAIRATYRLYHADESLSPDQLGSSK